MTIELPSKTIPRLSLEQAAGKLGRATYGNDGAIIVPSVFRAEEMDEFRTVYTEKVEQGDDFAKIDHHIDRGDVLGRYHRFVQPHRYPETKAGTLALDYMFDDRLHSVARNLVGPVHGAQSMFHFKPPSARGQAMHQDNYYLQTHPETCIAAWIAIDDADERNGAIKVVPGSHRKPLICHEAADQTTSYASNGVPLLPGTEQVLAELKSGDVLFFHGSMFHGSDPNTTTDRFRRCLIYHYVPQDSVKIGKFFQPLVKSSGEELEIGIAKDGGPCGEGWVEDGAAP